MALTAFKEKKRRKGKRSWQTEALRKMPGRKKKKRGLEIAKRPCCLKKHKPPGGRKREKRRIQVNERKKKQSTLVAWWGVRYTKSGKGPSSSGGDGDNTENLTMHQANGIGWREPSAASINPGNRGLMRGLFLGKREKTKNEKRESST